MTEAIEKAKQALVNAAMDPDVEYATLGELAHDLRLASVDPSSRQPYIEAYRAYQRASRELIRVREKFDLVKYGRLVPWREEADRLVVDDARKENEEANK